MEQVLKESPVKLTESAYDEMKRIFSDKNLPSDHGLRIGVKGGGCAGFSYILGFDAPKEKDTIYQFNDLKVIMEDAHGIYLAGMEIDYKDGLDARGFVFNNPNADTTCGCGSSFG